MVGDINTCMIVFVLLKDLTPNFVFLDAYVYVNTYNAHDEKKSFDRLIVNRLDILDINILKYLISDLQSLCIHY